MPKHQIEYIVFIEKSKPLFPVGFEIFEVFECAGEIVSRTVTCTDHCVLVTHQEILQFLRNLVLSHPVLEHVPETVNRVIVSFEKLVRLQVLHQHG